MKNHTSRNQSVNAIIARNMVTPKLIVATPHDVFDVAFIISLPHVQIHVKPLQNAHFVLEIIQPVTRDVQYTERYNVYNVREY